MSTSPTRGKARIRRTALDRRLRAEARASQTALLPRRARLQRSLGWPLCAAGFVLFLVTYVASVSGTILLPFDQHHLIGQLGGGVLALTGLTWATRAPGRERRPPTMSR